VLSTARRGSIGAGAPALARTLDGFVRMYDAHMAIEDTLVFPAWKTTLSSKQLDEIGESFEDIERATFGTDGFGAAVAEMERIEGIFGLSDLASYTAPPPSV
jgi:hemerythrin-like domain-containing protein